MKPLGSERFVQFMQRGYNVPEREVRMKIRLNVTGVLFALVLIAMLACSPGAIVGEITGGNATMTPTKFALAATTPVPSVSSVPSIPTPTLTLTLSPTLTPIPGSTNTPSSVLPLRTD